MTATELEESNGAKHCEVGQINWLPFYMIVLVLSITHHAPSDDEWQ